MLNWYKVCQENFPHTIIIIICYIYISLFWVLNALYIEGGNLHNHHQCAASTWMMRQQPYCIPPPPLAWTVETPQDGSMLSCSLCQILTLPTECRSRNRDSSDKSTFFQSSIVQFWWACVNCSLRVLLLADRSGTRFGFLLLWPIRFRVRRVVHSEMVFCIPWL